MTRLVWAIVALICLSGVAQGAESAQVTPRTFTYMLQASRLARKRAEAIRTKSGTGPSPSNTRPLLPSQLITALAYRASKIFAAALLIFQFSRKTSLMRCCKILLTAELTGRPGKLT